MDKRNVGRTVVGNESAPSEQSKWRIQQCCYMKNNDVMTKTVAHVQGNILTLYF